jgi:hypothetical protein
VIQEIQPSENFGRKFRLGKADGTVAGQAADGTRAESDGST